MGFTRKLTNGQYAAMMNDLAKGMLKKDAAVKYGVSTHTVGRYTKLKKEKPPRKLHPCGTIGAYRRHLRAGEPPCEACSAANAWMTKKYKRRAKRRKKAS